jgi:hypothetical protein
MQLNEQYIADVLIEEAVTSQLEAITFPDSRFFKLAIHL